MPIVRKEVDNDTFARLAERQELPRQMILVEDKGATKVIDIRPRFWRRVMEAEDAPLAGPSAEVLSDPGGSEGPATDSGPPNGTAGADVLSSDSASN